MTMLVSLDEAKDQCSVLRTNDYFDNPLELYVEIASSLAMKFLKLSEVPDEWHGEYSPANISSPGWVKGPVLLMVAEMFVNRESSVSDVLSEFVKNLLWSERPRTIA